MKSQCSRESLRSNNLPTSEVVFCWFITVDDCYDVVNVCTCQFERSLEDGE